MYNIVYDIDDCLLATNEYICDCLGLNIEDFKDWGFDSLKEYKDKIFSMFREYDTYSKSKIYNGVEDVLNIPNVYLHTQCISPEAGKAKLDRMINLGFSSSNIILDYCYPKLSLGSEILIEDNLDNVLRSKAKTKILIDRPWNRVDKLDKSIIRVYSLTEANSIVYEILKL